LKTIIQSREDKENNVTIQVSGDFEFCHYSKFKLAYEKWRKTTNFTIDLTECQKMDTCALGMLLLLLDYNRCNDSYALHNIKIRAGTLVERMIKISNFDRLFNIVKV